MDNNVKEFCERIRLYLEQARQSRIDNEVCDKKLRIRAAAKATKLIPRIFRKFEKAVRKGRDHVFVGAYFNFSNYLCRTIDALRAVPELSEEFTFSYSSCKIGYTIRVTLR